VTGEHVQLIIKDFKGTI